MARNLSSASYLTMEPKNPTPDEPRYADGRAKPTQIPIRTAATCDHEAYVCLTMECIKAWQEDHIIHFERTTAGRRFKRELGL